MAEIRKHNPRVTSDIGAQVRELMGETIRPVEPGSHRAPAPGAADLAPEHDDDMYDPFDQGGTDAAGTTLIGFSAAADPVIGAVPGDFITWAKAPGE